MVVEWSSPDVGNVVDFPIDRACLCYRNAICHVPIFRRGNRFLGGRRHDEIDDLRRDIRDLREEITKLRKQQ